MYRAVYGLYKAVTRLIHGRVHDGVKGRGRHPRTQPCTGPVHVSVHGRVHLYTARTGRVWAVYTCSDRARSYTWSCTRPCSRLVHGRVLDRVHGT